MILCGQRYYHPATGKGLTRDPIGYAGGINLYGYTKNNPVMGVDPSGLDDKGSFFAWLAEAARSVAEDQKAILFDFYGGMGDAGIPLAGLTTSGVDFVTGLVAFPGDVARLGEGSGRYAGDPENDPYGLGIWQDVGVGSSALLMGAVRVPNIKANNAAGKVFEDQVAASAKKLGYDVERQVYYRTPYGRRFVDLRLSKNGKVVANVECKSGRSRYTTLQRTKDAYIRRTHGHRTMIVRDK